MAMAMSIYRTLCVLVLKVFFEEGCLPSVVDIAILNSSMVQNLEPIEEEESWLYVPY